MYFLFVLSVQLIALVFSLGLDQSIAREYHVYSNKFLLLIHAVSPALLTLNLFGLVILSINPLLFSEILFDVPSWQISFLLFGSINLELMIVFISIFLRMAEKPIQYSFLRIIPRIIFILVIIFAFYYQPSDYESIFVLVLSHFISLLVTLLSSLFFIRVSIFNARDIFFDKDLFKRITSFGVPLIFISIGMWLINTFDKVILRYTQQLEELALVSVAVTVGIIASFISSIFNTLWTPLVYKWDSGNKDMTIINSALENMILIIKILFLGVLTISWIIPYLFPQDYHDVQYLIFGTLCGYFFYTMSEITGVGIGIRRKTKYYLFISTTSVVISLISAFLLVPAFGAKGALTSFAISNYVFFTLRTFVSMKLILGFKCLKAILFGLFLLITSILIIFFGNLLPSEIHILYLILFFGVLFRNFERLKVIYHTFLIARSWIRLIKF